MSTERSKNAEYDDGQVSLKSVQKESESLAINGNKNWLYVTQMHKEILVVNSHTSFRPGQTYKKLCPQSM